jgi:hypothetical protein
MPGKRGEQNPRKHPREKGLHELAGVSAKLTSSVKPAIGWGSLLHRARSVPTDFHSQNKDIATDVTVQLIRDGYSPIPPQPPFPPPPPPAWYTRTMPHPFEPHTDNMRHIARAIILSPTEWSKLGDPNSKQYSELEPKDERQVVDKVVNSQIHGYGRIGTDPTLPPAPGRTVHWNAPFNDMGYADVPTTTTHHANELNFTDVMPAYQPQLQAIGVTYQNKFIYLLAKNPKEDEWDDGKNLYKYTLHGATIHFPTTGLHRSTIMLPLLTKTRIGPSKSQTRRKPR